MSIRMVGMPQATLATFLIEEMERRHLSIREFSRLAGLGHETVSKLVNPRREEDKYPSVRTLVKIAEFTKTDLCALVGLGAPEVAHVNPQVQMLAERMSRLPKEQQEIIDRYISYTVFMTPRNEGAFVSPIDMFSAWC